MPYRECKVYNDGSHYIAIPHTEKPYRPRRKPKEEIITVTEKSDSAADMPEATQDKCISTRQTTKKELFEELYVKYADMRKSERKEKIISEMKPYFDSTEETADFVKRNLERKKRNLICRKIRLSRKANLQTWNFFCTGTRPNPKSRFRAKFDIALYRNCASKYFGGIQK